MKLTWSEKKRTYSLIVGFKKCFSPALIKGHIILGGPSYGLMLGRETRKKFHAELKWPCHPPLCWCFFATLVRCSSGKISNNNSKKAQNSSSRLPGGVPFATGNHAVKGRSFPDTHHTKPCLFYSTLLVFYCHSRRASKAQRPSFLNCWWLLLPRPALKCALV